MAWRFEPGEELCAAFRRVALEEIARIRAGLTSPEIDRDTAIHQARQGFKRMRALVRLAKPQLGAEFAAENERWRDAGRLLSGSRDIAVLHQTYDKLIAERGADLPAAKVRRLRSRLAANGAAPPEPAEAEANVRRVLDLLDEAASTVGRLGWPDSAAALRKGLHKCQARLKRDWKKAHETLEADALHSWRKCVKDQTAQLRLFRRALPDGFRGRRTTGKAIGELLGDEHDLWLLAERLQHRTVPADLADIRDFLLKEIDKRRTSLRRRAFAEGEAFSLEKGKSFASAIGGAWDKASKRKLRVERRKATRRRNAAAKGATSPGP